MVHVRQLCVSSDVAVYQKWTHSFEKKEEEEEEIWSLSTSRPLMNEDRYEDRVLALPLRTLTWIA